MSETFARKNPKSGLIELVDMKSGEVVAVQRSAYPLFAGEQQVMVEQKLPDGSTVRVQKGVDIGLLASTEHLTYNQVMVDLICQKITEGYSLSKICRMEGFPSYSTISHWRRINQVFNKQLEEAKRDRAEYYRDKVIEEAENAESTKDPINAHALRVEAYKWAAGMDDAKYSPKSKVEATLNTPVQIIVDTGIDRRPIEREVSDDSDKTQMAPALPDSSGESATTSQSFPERDLLEVHPIPVTTPEPRNDLAGG